MNDETWLRDVVTRCGVPEPRAGALARAGAQMLRRLAIKCPPGIFGKGECCRRAVALELAAREAGGANLRREALLTACSARQTAYERVLRHAESALGTRTAQTLGSAAVVDTIEALARAVVSEQDVNAVADAARGLQSLLRRGAHPDGAQRAACVGAAAQILDIDSERLCAAAGCSAADFATASRDLDTARRRQRDESQLSFFDAPPVAARGAGTRGARAREAVLARRPDVERSPSPVQEEEEEEGDTCYEDFALELLREECERRDIPCPATLVPSEAIDEVYGADLETEELKRMREAFPTLNQWEAMDEDDAVDDSSDDGGDKNVSKDFVCQKGCERAFATARGRGVHERTCIPVEEEAEVALVCRKGCGRAFGAARGRATHEQTCPGAQDSDGEDAAPGEADEAAPPPPPKKNRRESLAPHPDLPRETRVLPRARPWRLENGAASDDDVDETGPPDAPRKRRSSFGSERRAAAGKPRIVVSCASGDRDLENVARQTELCDAAGCQLVREAADANVLVVGPQLDPKTSLAIARAAGLPIVSADWLRARSRGYSQADEFDVATLARDAAFEKMFGVDLGEPLRPRQPGVLAGFAVLPRPGAEAAYGSDRHRYEAAVEAGGALWLHKREHLPDDRRLINLDRHSLPAGDGEVTLDERDLLLCLIRDERPLDRLRTRAATAAMKR